MDREDDVSGGPPHAAVHPSDGAGGPGGLILLWLALPFLLILFVDFLVLRDAAKERDLHERVATWPATEGAVIESKVNSWIRERRSGGKNSTTRRVLVHGADIRYRYSVGGIAYDSRAIRPGTPPIDDDRAVAEAIVARYPAGSAVKVLHDPDFPGRSCLENPPPAPASPLGFLLANLAGILLGCANLYWCAGLGMLGDRARDATLALRSLLPLLPHPGTPLRRR